MKMRLHIPLVLVAVLALLLMPCVTHHHHGDVICTVTEHCDKDDVDNDRHTHHAGACMEKGDYLDSRQDHGTGIVKFHPGEAVLYVSAVEPFYFPFIIDCSSRVIVKYRKTPCRAHKPRRAPPVSPDFGTRA